MLNNKNWVRSEERQELLFAIQALDRFVETDTPIKECLVDLIQRANEVIEAESSTSDDKNVELLIFHS